jgi:glutaminyl-peptide cyclotransferase
MDDSIYSLRFQSKVGDPCYKICTSQYEVVNCYPHDAKAFTEGLQVFDRSLYESTGSDLRRVDLKTGIVLEKIPVDKDYLAEGITILGERIFQLTELSRRCLIYDLNDLSNPAREVECKWLEKGWGLTNDGKNLIISDSTDILYFVDPDSFKVNREVPVRLDGKPLYYLNELEFIDGLIYANVHRESFIVVINPQDGKVLKHIDLSALRPRETDTCDDCFLNGIAHDEESGHLFVTGKMWPLLFEIRLTAKAE